jgi:hypothetical protein
MGTTRGGKKKKAGKLRWGNRKANHGRRPTMGKRTHMSTWQEVRKKMLANATVIITPKTEDEAPKAE